MAGVLTMALLCLGRPADAAEKVWQPVAGRMMTPWGEALKPDDTWREYPRPQFERLSWQNLNGLWDYAVTPKNATTPSGWAGKILVPFCVESTLSGVGRELQPEQALWYRRVVTIKPKSGWRVWLNFEAVDYHATVWVNGQQVGEHTGGNTAFQFDITPALRKGANEIVVRVLDETGGTQLRGKQALEPHGIWYTRVSGIWQTVWLEDVPAVHLREVKITTSLQPATIRIAPVLEGAQDATVRVTARFKGRRVAGAEGAAQAGLELVVPGARLWSPAHPDLYDLQIELLDAKGRVVDAVKSYAGIREFGQRRDAQGHLRFTLNGEEIFCWGPLDQGWWPDGLLTPPSDAAMRSDIDFLKAAGFNTIRKHIKVEPRRYYAYCDRVGLLLWQDQVSAAPGKSGNGRETSPPWTRLAPNPKDAEWSEAEHEQWLAELGAMMDELQNQPCIVVWVPFNEAWGQHRSVEIGNWIMSRDPTRLLNIASGGNFWPVGQIADAHRYPDPGFPFEQERLNDYVKVVGEFGGHGWPERGHLWRENIRNWGYGGLPGTKEELITRYAKSLGLLADLKAKGVSGGIYTQTTDVEGEINGLITYDRRVIKIPAPKLAELHSQLGEDIRR